MKHSKWDGVDRVLFEESIEAVEVPVLTVGQALAQYGSKDTMIMLQIDTEGFDLHVLRSAEVSDFFPPIVSYEHKHLSFEDQTAARMILAQRDYTFYSDEVDTVAYRY